MTGLKHGFSLNPKHLVHRYMHTRPPRVPVPRLVCCPDTDKLFCRLSRYDAFSGQSGVYHMRPALKVTMIHNPNRR
jgi:hypothetical protein